jgi:hypothetical protein
VLTGAAGAAVTLALDGVVVHDPPAATLGVPSVAAAQFGNEVRKQAFTLHVDDVLIEDR